MCEREKIEVRKKIRSFTIYQPDLSILTFGDLSLQGLSVCLSAFLPSHYIIHVSIYPNSYVYRYVYLRHQWAYALHIVLQTALHIEDIFM